MTHAAEGPALSGAPSEDTSGVGAPGTTLAEDDLSQQHPVLQRLRMNGVSVGTGARQGAMWAVGSRVGSQIIQFLGTIVTARLLMPDDYGVTAVVFPIIAFANIFNSLGLGSTVIHARRVTEPLLSTAFWINFVMGLALTGIVAGLSIPLSHLFGIPQLVPLLCLASLLFTVNVSVVQVSLLERTLRFKQVAIVETACMSTGIAVTVVTAALGAGPFSLILGPLANQVSLSIVMWLVVRWRPRALPDRASMRQFWTMSRGITGFSVLNFWSRNADNLLLARVVTLAELGNYNRAYNLMRLPVLQMNTMMSRVLFPALTRLRDDRVRLSNAWLRALSTAGAATAPMAIGMAVAAPALVEVLFGPRWLGMVTVLELLALSALPQTLTTTVAAVLRATGATDTLFRLGLLTAAMSITAILIGLRWGTIGVATALAVKFYLETLVSLRVSLRHTALRWRDLVRAMGPIWLACAALGGAGLAVRFSTGDDLPAWQVLLAQIAAGGTAYIAVLLLVDRAALRQAVRVFRRSGNNSGGRPTTSSRVQ
jgi:O-antigen/teichoic acid export membrane protein